MTKPMPKPADRPEAKEGTTEKTRRGPTPDLPSLARVAQRVAGGTLGLNPHAEVAEGPEDAAASEEEESRITPEERAALVWDLLGRAYHLVFAEIKGSLGKDQSLTRVALLDQLQQARRGISSAVLADRLHLPLGSLRSLITRMQRQKLVQRKVARGKTPDQVSLTAKGKKLAAELVGRYHRDLAEILCAAPEGSLDTLHAALAQTVEGLEGRFARQSRGRN